MRAIEGLLKRRIWENLLATNPRIKTIDEAELDKILDEAWQDCPVWWKSGDRVYKWREMTEEQRKVAVYFYIDATGFPAWFFKWFGDPK